MFKVILTNSFHNTKVTVLSDTSRDPSETWYQIQVDAMSGNANDRRKLRRVRNALCGIAGCTCGTFRPK